MYYVYQKESNYQCAFATREKAEKAVAEFEKDDRKNGVFQNGRYEIVNRDDEVAVRMTTEEKLKRIAEMTATELLDALDYYHTHWNPINEDMWESRDLVREEIIKRMEK